MMCMLQGLFEFRFQLVYTSLEEQLVKIKELWDLALKQKGKERDAQSSAKQRLSAIIQACATFLPMRCTALLFEPVPSLIWLTSFQPKISPRYLAFSQARFW